MTEIQQESSSSKKRRRKMPASEDEHELDFSLKNLQISIESILGCRSSSLEVVQSNKCVATKLLKFIHGCMFSLADGRKNCMKDMKTVMPMDSPGIIGISSSLKWIAHYVAVLPKGYNLINSRMQLSDVPSSQTCVANLQCLQAFTELVQRTAHFQIFGTGMHCLFYSIHNNIGYELPVD
jgi:hypothetical protein